MSLGLVSLRKGMASGIPGHLQGSARLVIDSSMSAPADVDIDSAGAHTIEGRTWTMISADADTATVTASGTRLVSSSANKVQLWTTIPFLDADSWVCVGVTFAPVAMDKNAQTIQLRLGQADGATDTQEDVVALLRRGTSSSYRLRCGYRGSSAWSFSSVDDNPMATSLPASLQLMLWGHGNTWSARAGTGTGPPTFRGVTATNGASARICTRSAGSVKAATPALLNRIKLAVVADSDNIEAFIKHVRVWVGSLA